MTGRRSPVDVARVKQLLAGGLTHKQVSLRLGCSKSVVSMISRGVYREGKA
jgi:DNA-binding CsgD family transcriptional regulator